MLSGSRTDQVRIAILLKRIAGEELSDAFILLAPFVDDCCLFGVVFEDRCDTRAFFTGR